jgi:hypothetical protein
MAFENLLRKCEENLLDLQLYLRYFDLTDLEFLGFSPEN